MTRVAYVVLSLTAAAQTVSFPATTVRSFGENVLTAFICIVY